MCSGNEPAAAASSSQQQQQQAAQRSSSIAVVAAEKGRKPQSSGSTPSQRSRAFTDVMKSRCAYLAERYASLPSKPRAAVDMISSLAESESRTIISACALPIMTPLIAKIAKTTLFLHL